MAEALTLSAPLKLPPPDTVDVWLVQLEPGTPDTAEHARAAARHATRALLARYCDMHPAALHFEVGPYGKPRLRGAPLSFSVARRRGRALLAVAAEGRVGVDLERRGKLPELDAICAMLHPAERALLGQASAGRRDNLFYRLWTRKEAALKAVGTGLAFGLDRVDVTGRYALVPFADRWPRAALLSLHDIALGSGWFAALAGEAGCRTPRLFTLPEAGAPQESSR